MAAESARSADIEDETTDRGDKIADSLDARLRNLPVQEHWDECRARLLVLVDDLRTSLDTLADRAAMSRSSVKKCAYGRLPRDRFSWVAQIARGAARIEGKSHDLARIEEIKKFILGEFTATIPADPPAVTPPDLPMTEPAPPAVPGVALKRRGRQILAASMIPAMIGTTVLAWHVWSRIGGSPPLPASSPGAGAALRCLNCAPSVSFITPPARDLSEEEFKAAVGDAAFCKLTANPSRINPGEKFRLTWTSYNVGPGRISQIGESLNPSGAANVSDLMTTRTFYGTFAGAGGTAHCQTTVTVVGQAERSSPPVSITSSLENSEFEYGVLGNGPVCEMSAEPKIIARGEKVELKWRSSNTKSGRITKIDKALTRDDPSWGLNGGANVNNLAETTTFYGTFFGDHGTTATCQVTVFVK